MRRESMPTETHSGGRSLPSAPRKNVGRMPGFVWEEMRNKLPTGELPGQRRRRERTGYFGAGDPLTHQFSLCIWNCLRSLRASGLTRPTVEPEA
jgi:hypothetical protein